MTKQADLRSRLLSLRLRRNLTYAEMAELAGLSTSALHRYLSGDTEPQERTLYRLNSLVQEDGHGSQKSRR